MISKRCGASHMPNRIIREGILTSERVNSLSERAEVFYRRLMSVVDDFGRFTANPTLLRASCYPLKLDSVKEDSIKKHLAEAEDAGLIVLYTVAGKAYLELQDFRQQVRAKESKFPPPDKHPLSTCVADAKQVIADAHLDGDVVGDEDEDVISSASADRIPYDGIVAAYHEALPMLPVVRKLTDQRRRKLRRCWQDDRERQSLDYWKRFFAYVGTSDFLTGRSGRFTACDFEWLVEPSRHLKVSEGKYENREAA